MTPNPIWAVGLLEHLVLAGILLARRRVSSFPFFTLLILFNILRALVLPLALGHVGRQNDYFVAMVFDITDILLEFAVLGELSFLALRQVNRFGRITLRLLLPAIAVAIVVRLAPISHYSVRLVSLQVHFLLAIIMLEWAIVLALLLRTLRISWRSHVAAITFGFGVYAATLLFAGGYFSTGRELRDYVFFSYFRIAVYLLVVLWWIFSLWRETDSAKAALQM